MTDVVMPQMGESIVEGTLTKWLKKAGERVERDEPLFEISTDKVDTEIPSPAAGTLSEVLVEEGKTVGINTVVARIEEGGGAQAAPQPAARQTRSGRSAADNTAGATPGHATRWNLRAGDHPARLLRRGAEEPAAETRLVRFRLWCAGWPVKTTSISAHVKGTGAGGRITKQDIEAHLAQQQAARLQPPTPPQPVKAPAALPPQPRPLPPPEASVARTRIEPMSTMRIKIAEHMVVSKRTSAHVTTIHKVDMTKVAKMREKHKADFQARYGISLTYLPFITRAAVEGLRTYPLLNAAIEGNNIIYHNEINIGIAVALENGLIVPVIRNADEKNVLGLQRSIVDLAARARSRHLKPDEVPGRHLLHHQFRQLRQRDRHAGHQPAAGGDPGRRRGGKDAGRDATMRSRSVPSATSR